MLFRNFSNVGLLLEDKYFLYLRRQGYGIEYVRTARGYETDLSARHGLTGDVQLIQVCWDLSNEEAFTREVRGLEESMQQFGIDLGTIVTWDEFRSNGKGIDIVPVWKWMV